MASLSLLATIKIVCRTGQRIEIPFHKRFWDFGFILNWRKKTWILWSSLQWKMLKKIVLRSTETLSFDNIEMFHYWFLFFILHWNIQYKILKKSNWKVVSKPKNQTILFQKGQNRMFSHYWNFFFSLLKQNFSEINLISEVFQFQSLFFQQAIVVWMP